MCNDIERITNRRTQKRAAALMQTIVSAKGQRGAARMLHLNPGTVHHVLDDTPESWKHVNMDTLLLAKVELAAAYVVEDDNLSDEIKQSIDRVMALESELSGEMRRLHKKIKRL